MRTFTRKLTASTLAAAMTTCMTVTAFAAEPAEEHIQISGYDCVVENGQYYTEIDGERYQVVNLDEYMPEVVSSMVGSKESSSVLSVNETKTQIYSDTVNLTRDGDYTSPVIDCNPTGGFYLSIRYQAIWNEKVKISMILHSNQVQVKVPTINETLNFSIFASECKLVIVGEGVAKYVKQCELKIFEEGTTLGSPFSYTLYSY